MPKRSIRRDAAPALGPLIVLALVLGAPAGAHDAAGPRPPAVRGHLDAVARLLEAHPEMVVDLRAESGEYCFNTWKVGGAHMTHYAVDPSATVEDVVDFVRIEALADTLDVDALPRLPGELGAMEPGRWYYLPAGAYDPHHRARFPFPLLMRATNVQ